MMSILYPSNLGTTALACDISVPSFGDPAGRLVRIRLINVLLEPLEFVDYRRWQLAVASSFLRQAGHGLMAGDFNAIQPEDSQLVETCGLVDAWIATHPGEEGFTWGRVGDPRYPPTRLDKVATLGLQAVDVILLHPGTVPIERAGRRENLPWSDHSGLLCIFGNAS
ncbi:hypothetical protein GE09DRAFT_1091234 [Coniochaeta sp. 2T2.1]|nr:hypothetical protein GE09DRAFT_1091234 [Coniochaeta sp. 2T2.1]